ncbi:MAG: alpha/beta hydrolase-fold protein [Actinobacteria bacterium]|nr:alpha/beta hydrolase-fold protein [Actinomycetota bacterium]
MNSLKSRIILIGMVLIALAMGSIPAEATTVLFPGARPFSVIVPTTYQKSKPAPLILALHGYTSSGDETEKYLQLAAVAQTKGILYVHPDGTQDGAANRFWNATPACCNFYSSKVNDEAYLMSIIDSVSKKYNVDQKRIYVIGHSNGGFMTHHMGCSEANRIAAIASFSGATYDDPKTCKPSSPISVLQIWGTADETIAYNGGSIISNAYPGALKTVASWAKLDSCSMKLISSTKKLDLEAKLAGAETSVSYYSGCKAKTSVELWTINGGAHVPSLVKNFASQVVDFLLAHPKV